MEKFKKSQGFRYLLTKEAIRHYLSLTLKDRLQWLEEANKFLYAIHSPTQRKVWIQFRNGLV